ncbi:MAG: DUF484 family protein [Alphaproteobacteria bacterium]|nr:DUF484 family protein [Alphaproteobacteria bacterium]TAD89353.1 MAG: DUF484 family protein [Alphaproteobacteria bacterium]
MTDPVAEPRILSAADVEAYLERHPRFFLNRSELFDRMAVPDRTMGDQVVDLQSVLLHRLREDHHQLKTVQRTLIQSARVNQQIQNRVHQAVLALLGARGFEQIIQVITGDLSLILDIDAVGLCLEATHGAADAIPGAVIRAGVQILQPGVTDQLIGPGRDVILRADVIGDPVLFGTSAAGLVRSDALVRLRFSQHSPAGLLALGARTPDAFNPGQGTELLAFLAGVIEHLVRAWLDLPE